MTDMKTRAREAGIEWYEREAWSELDGGDWPDRYEVMYPFIQGFLAAYTEAHREGMLERRDVKEYGRQQFNAGMEEAAKVAEKWRCFSKCDHGECAQIRKAVADIRDKIEPEEEHSGSQ